MLHEVTNGVWVHRSEFVEANATVVQGPSGVLLIDPGVYTHELDCLADDLDALHQPVVAGFATHPHWDHLLWSERFGVAPHYATAICVDTIRARLAEGIDPAAFGIPDDVELNRLDQLTPLPDTTTEIPWDGPRVRIVEHRAHAPGHAALVVEDASVLVAGDLLSELLIPLLNMNGPEPVGDYLDALALLRTDIADVSFLIPGHGSVATGEQVRERWHRDRAYVEALRDARTPDDPRLAPTADDEGMAPLHEQQAQQLAARAESPPQ